LRTKMGLALWLNPVIRCDLHRLPLRGTKRTLEALVDSVPVFPHCNLL
jgi:hypothetical protein